MVLDPELLKKARARGTELAELERQALLARADYHAAIRRLHLAGASLREIASALALSHQRVQQIVENAGGSWWQRVWRTRNQRDAVCTFCGLPPSEVSKLVAGPDLFICDACVAEADGLLKDEEHEVSSAFVRSSDSTTSRCSFCRKRRRPLITRSGAKVCGDCLRLAGEIIVQRGE